MTDNRAEADPSADQLAESAVTVSGKPPRTHYDTEEEAIKHSGRVSTLLEQIANKHTEQDPYAEQITEMESKGIQTVNFDEINRLTRLLQHQEYLLDLLTNKKSFVRKRIIEQNLSYLNARLTHYLDRMGLPHQVVFQNDLSVEITELGRELDFDNLSRGERNRLILGLSFAFRDVWENLYAPINVLFVDELIDNGLDTIGVENSIALLKDMTRRRHKSIWLVSHRDELTNRVSSVLKVIKEGGFTSYNTSSEYTE
jgi:DNA repair exonuclease SbcCD ATPase subunit